MRFRNTFFISKISLDMVTLHRSFQMTKSTNFFSDQTLGALLLASQMIIIKLAKMSTHTKKTCVGRSFWQKSLLAQISLLAAPCHFNKAPHHGGNGQNRKCSLDSILELLLLFRQGRKKCNHKWLLQGPDHVLLVINIKQLD